MPWFKGLFSKREQALGASDWRPPVATPEPQPRAVALKFVGGMYHEEAEARRVLNGRNLEFFLRVFDELSPRTKYLAASFLIGDRLHFLCDKVQSFGEPALQALLDRLASGLPQVQLNALVVLGHLGLREPRLVTRLKPLLRSYDPGLRTTAMSALIDFCPPEMPEVTDVWVEQAEHEIAIFSSTLSKAPREAATGKPIVSGHDAALVPLTMRGLHEALVKHSTAASRETLIRAMNLQDIGTVEYPAFCVDDRGTYNFTATSTLEFSKSRELAHSELRRRGQI